MVKVRSTGQLVGLFLVSVLIDGIGMLSYLIPGVSDLLDLPWAPISGLLIRHFYPDAPLIAPWIGFLEELLPMTDIIPTATLCFCYISWLTITSKPAPVPSAVYVGYTDVDHANKQHRTEAYLATSQIKFVSRVSSGGFYLLGVLAGVLVWLSERCHNGYKGVTHRTTDMDALEALCARLSNEVYELEPQAVDGYLPMHRNPFGSYPFDYVVFVNTLEQRVVLAFRGTADKGDLAVDVFDIMHRGADVVTAIVGNKNTSIVGNLARELLDKVLAHHEEHMAVTCTGHSLGGYLAAHAIHSPQASVSQRAEGLHHVFNPGAGLMGDAVYNSPRLQCHHVMGDLLSTTCGLRKKIYACKETNAHKMTNFI